MSYVFLVARARVVCVCICTVLLGVRMGVSMHVSITMDVHVSQCTFSGQRTKSGVGVGTSVCCIVYSLLCSTS